MKNPGGLPAFPCPETDYYKAWDGITIRQYAAIKIMAGLSANPETINDGPIIAAIAVEWADALIAALETPAIATPEEATSREG